MIGACNKNGYFYALTANPLSSSPVWSKRIGVAAGDHPFNACLTSAIWDAPNGRLFIAGNETKIGGVDYRGSIRRVNPSTGAFIWQRGLPCEVVGSPSLDGAGVLAVATWDNCETAATDQLYLVDASDGTVLKTVSTGGSKTFAQPVFADNYLFVASEAAGLSVYQPS
jgi:hypothetical protein